MFDALFHVFDTSDFPPRWSCGPGWQNEPAWGWLHIVSDLAVWGAYLAIPILLAYFLRRRPDIPFPRILWLFVAFIFACGTVHLVEAGMFWWPAYRLSGLVKLATAIVSWATVFALVPVLPLLLSFRSPMQLADIVKLRTEELERLTGQLQQEVDRRAQIAKTLEEKEARLRMALRGGRMGTWDWDLTTGNVAMDAMELELTNFSVPSGSIHIDQFFERVYPPDLPGLRAAIEKAMSQGKEYNHEFRFVLPEGEMLWIAGRGEVEFDAGKRPIRMRGINYDTTQERLSHQALLESEAFLRSLLDSSADCIKVLDLQGRLLSINRAGLTALDIDDFDSIYGRTWQSLWPDKYALETEQVLRTARSGGIGRFQGVCPTFKKSLKSWDVILTPIGDLQEGAQRLLCISRDMTEFQDLSRARQETEDRFRTLADNIDQFAWMTDETGAIFWYNQRWFEYTGTTLEEMKGWGWKAVHHPDHLERVVKKFQHSLQSGSDWEDTFPLRSKDNTYRWFLSRARTIRDEQEHVIGWFGTNTDITERLAADQALARAHAQLKSIVDAAADAIVTIDDQGKILSANSAVERIFGFQARESVGQSIDDLIPSANPDGETAARSDERSSSRHLVIRKRQECLGRRKDGRFVPLEVSFSKSRVGSRQIYAGIIRDITERKQTEEVLRIRTRAIEFATNSIFITDAHSAHDAIIYVNPAFEELTGYAAQEAIGKNCNFLQGKETAPSQAAVIRRAFQQREECHVTILHYRKDGSHFWNDMHISPVQDDSGQVTHFIGIQADITARVRYEHQLREAQQQADSANRAKSEFLANMSHEIRTPLTAILGCADALFRQIEDPDPKDVIRMIRNQGQLLMGILNDVLDLSKIEAGKLEINLEDCELVRTLGDVHSLMHSQAVEQGIELRTVYLSRVPERLHTDPLRARQILLNIVSNAIKFTKAGHVEIQVSCHEDQNQGWLQVAVEDTGIGIAPDRLQTIFEAFAQERNSMTARIPGTGLGLTICQRLVDMLGGRISVTSKLGSGSRFVIELPLGRIQTNLLMDPDDLTRKAALRDSQMAIDYFVPCRVLIAEDTRGIQFMMTRMLQDVVTSLQVVDNGELAVAEVMHAADSDQPFDIVLMDMQMPVMDGFDATKKLRQLGYTLPIIALTAGAMAGDKERCLQAGCTDYLPKPIDRLELIEKLRCHCDPAP